MKANLFIVVSEVAFAMSIAKCERIPGSTNNNRTNCGDIAFLYVRSTSPYSTRRAPRVEKGAA